MSSLQNVVMGLDETLGKRLISDSDEWKEIALAFAELEGARVSAPYDAVLQTAASLLQAVYILGYQRGQREATMPKFVVLEDK